MASTPSRGAGIYPPPNFAVPVPGATGLSTPLTAIAGAGPVSLAAGEVFLLPAGQYMVQPGPYTFLQYRDPVLGLWRTLSQQTNILRYITSDGGNYRLANLSGCAAGAFITNVGSGYTSVPTVTPDVGSSTWQAILGGAINATVTVTTAGTYNYAPLILFSPPPAGGVQATGYVTMSGTAISSVTVVNQGAGYTSAPTVTIIQDPRDTAAGGGVLTVNSTLVGSGTVTGILCTNHGTPVTAVAALTIAGGGGSNAAATAVMCFAATGITVTAGGAGYGNAQPFGILTIGGIVGGSAGATVNPALGSNMFIPRQATGAGTSTAGGAITATGFAFSDAGLFQAVPNALVIAGGTGLATGVGTATVTVGGLPDTSYIYVA